VGPQGFTHRLQGVNVMTRMLQVPRSRGAVSGLLLVLLGLWGALIPLVGPYFHYAYTPDSAWTLTAGRVWLEIVPGAATFLGGMILLVSASRPLAMFGAELAAAGGAWFALGMVIIPLWPAASTLYPGSPAGATTVLRQLEHLGFYTGLGVVIVFVAALALGRLTVVGVRDARLAERGAVVAEPEPVAADATATRPIRAGSTTGATTTGTATKDATTTGTTTKDATSTGTTTARATGTGRPGSLHTFGRRLVARR
jgi:hypothetical protein